MLARIRSGDLEFDFDDFKSMLNLMCSIDQSSKDSAIDPGLGVPQSNGGGAVGEKGRRAYNEFLIELFTLDVE
jgi:exocyst complex component 4